MPPDLTRAVSAYKSVVDQLKAMFPEESEENLADTIEGCTTLDEVIVATIRNAIEREAHADALSDMIDNMDLRRRRMIEGAQRLRKGALDAMLTVGLTKIPVPDMTVSVRQGKPKVLVTNPAAVPDDYCEFERKIHKREIGDALAAGKDVPGAVLANGEPVLTVRRT